jgi:superfamily II DNA or RNA helicase
MTSITIPKLERIIHKVSANKNVIKQLIVSEKTIDLEVVDTSRSSISIKCGANSIYLTSSKNNVPDEIQYAILTNIKPTEDRIVNGEVVLKSWLKNPDYKELSQDEVIETWVNNFNFIEENLEKNINGLRLPQIGALHTLMGHLKLPLEQAIISLPTGTGKTETMLSALIANRCKKLLVTVPSDSLRTQISEKFLTLGLLREFKLIKTEVCNPIVGIVYQGFSTIEELRGFFEECNVIVTTMGILTSCSEEFQREISNICSHLFVDEAHHIKATSWNQFAENFNPTKIVQYTATPFRNDGKRINGKIIFNFPLSKAQEQGYFKHIDFLPVREYDPKKADTIIANKAIERLREDIANGYNHVLMARCYPTKRAKDVFELYRSQEDLNPVLLYSGAPDFKQSYEKILSKDSQKRARIIVCVDMLGEGFDLPELKIAAFHDIRKSLPITLQFAGRFTRTKYDEKLGNASFIANIANLDVKNELEDLYSRDADWNKILSDISFGKIEEQTDYKELLSGFKKLTEADIPFQNIKPKLSSVVYKNLTNTWNPKNFKAGISGYDDFEYKFDDLNSDENILVIITAKTEPVEWINDKDISIFNWNLILVYWETRNNLLFINSSDNSSLYKDIAEAILGENNAVLINRINVFKSFYGLDRTRLQNVGLRLFLGKDIRFRMSVGSDVGEALSIAEKQRGEKAFVQGVGYEDGEPVFVGASYKGRIWTKLVGDIDQFKKWCNHLGKKLANDEIDPNQILKDTLIPELVIERPSDLFPVWIDWDVEIYMSNESRFRFNIGGFIYDLAQIELQLSSPTSNGDLNFALVAVSKRIEYRIVLFENTENDNSFPDYRIEKLSRENVDIEFGSKKMNSIQFFEKFTPTIWFADGSALTGNEYVQLKQQINIYPKDKIETIDWTGIDLSKEAMGVNPKIENSIQYRMVEHLLQTDYDIIYDDDYSGEIADLLTIKKEDEHLIIGLYHLKFAIEGRVSNQIKNFYEVCGQAQKSVHWKHKDGKELINHLLRRIEKRKNDQVCSRLIKGEESDLDNLLAIVKQRIPVKYEIYIVQPGLSKQDTSNEILTLLGVTENYIKEIGGIDLKIIVNE